MRKFIDPATKARKKYFHIFVLTFDTEFRLGPYVKYVKALSTTLRRLFDFKGSVKRNSFCN